MEVRLAPRGGLRRRLGSGFTICAVEGCDRRRPGRRGLPSPPRPAAPAAGPATGPARAARRRLVSDRFRYVDGVPDPDLRRVGVVIGTTLATTSGLLSNFSGMPTVFQAVCVLFSVLLTVGLLVGPDDDPVDEGQTDEVQAVGGSRTQKKSVISIHAGPASVLARFS